MAHVQKLKIAAVGHMLDHYEREDSALERDNVDASRTSLNYELARYEGQLRVVNGLGRALRHRVEKSAEVHKETTGKAARSDAVRMADWVVTLPADCPQDREEDFFRAVLQFATERYGEDAVLGGFVHMDESTPHMHMPVIPMLDGRLNAKELISRADLRTWHDDLQKHLIEHGVPGTVVDVGGRRPNLESKLTQSDLRKLDAFISEKVASETSQSLSEARNLQNRVDALENENSGLKTALRASEEALKNEQGKAEALRARLAEMEKPKPQEKREGFDLSGIRSTREDRPGFNY